MHVPEREGSADAEASAFPDECRCCPNACPRPGSYGNLGGYRKSGTIKCPPPRRMELRQSRTELRKAPEKSRNQTAPAMPKSPDEFRKTPGNNLSVFRAGSDVASEQTQETNSRHHAAWKLRTNPDELRQRPVMPETNKRLCCIRYSRQAPANARKCRKQASIAAPLTGHRTTPDEAPEQPPGKSGTGGRAPDGVRVELTRPRRPHTPNLR